MLVLQTAMKQLGAIGGAHPIISANILINKLLQILWRHVNKIVFNADVGTYSFLSLLYTVSYFPVRIACLICGDTCHYPREYFSECGRVCSLHQNDLLQWKVRHISQEVRVGKPSISLVF